MTTKAKKLQRGKAVARQDDNEEDSARGKHFVNGLAKGLSMIQAFSAETPALTLAEAATATSLTRASARRILMTLEDLGFVAREGVRHFILTPKVLALGYSYLASTPLWSFASPILQELVEEVHETCAIAVQDGTDLVYVLRIPIHRILSQGVIVGSRLPLYCHSGGRVLLSDLSPAQLDSYFTRARLKEFTPRTVVDPARLRKLLKDVTRQQYAWVSSEIEENIAGLSVPIRQTDGRVIAALNVSVNQPAVKEDAMVKRLLPSLQAAADRIHASLLVGQPMRRGAGSHHLKGRGG
jgi:IclR family pca regulon transcriptional regulator